MSGLELYFILKLGALSGMFVALAILCGIACIVMLVVWAAMSEEGNGESALKVVKRFFPWVVPAGFLCAVIAAFIPTPQQAAAIIVVPKMVNAIAESEELMALPDDLVSLASEWIKELRPGNIKQK